MRYPVVLFDLDHTLFDTDTSLESALEHTVAASGLDDALSHYPTFREINGTLWRQVEAGIMTPPEVNLARFEQLADQVGLDADPTTLAADYAEALGQYGELYPGALELLDAMADHVTLALVTNGLSDVQRTRLDRLGIAEHFAAVTISAEVGVAKPAAGIFDITLAALDQPDPTSVLMVGDSLPSDIKGGADYGLDTCWYNPGAQPSDPQLLATHTVASLDEIGTVAAGG